MSVELAAVPRGPYSLALSARLSSDATRTFRDGLFTAVLEVEGRPELARATFECPVSKTTVNATFEASAEHEGELDVVACSMFGDGTVTCEKTCRALASVGWEPSAMVPRFSLLADGTAPR